MTREYNPFTAAKPTKFSAQVLPSEMEPGQRADGRRPHWNQETELPSPALVPAEELGDARKLPLPSSADDDDRLTDNHLPLDLLRK